MGKFGNNMSETYGEEDVLLILVDSARVGDRLAVFYYTHTLSYNTNQNNIEEMHKHLWSKISV